MLKKIVSVIAAGALIVCGFSEQIINPANDNIDNVKGQQKIVEAITEYTASNYGDGVSTSAQAAYLCELTSGKGLYAQNADARLPMASTTKIMTAIVVAELLPLDRIVTVTPEAAGVEGSSIYLYSGEKITVETLLYGLMLESANDAAAALAIETAGSIEKFAGLMNKKAEDIGLKNTHFTNPHGLDDEEHYTTARELCEIARYALSNETVAKIASTKTYRAQTIKGDTCRVMTNHNRLLFTYNGAVGMKTGYTKRTGRCLVSAAERNGMTLIAVTLNDRADWKDHKNMLDWGFENYSVIIPAEPRQYCIDIPVTGGISETVRAYNRDGLSLLVSNKDNTDYKVEICCNQFVFAPCPKGKKVGKVVFSIDEKIIGFVDLIQEDEVISKKPTGFLNKATDFLKRLFKL